MNLACQDLGGKSVLVEVQEQGGIRQESAYIPSIRRDDELINILTEWSNYKGACVCRETQ